MKKINKQVVALFDSIQVGDIILQDYRHKNKLLNWFLTLQDKIDDGQFNHVMMYIGDSMARSVEFNGVVNKSIQLSDPDYTVKRHRSPFSKDKFMCMFDTYERETSKKYGYMSLINASISSLLYRLLGRKIQLFKESYSYHCSRDVAEFYKLLNLPFNVDEDIITPNDIARDDNFIEVMV